MLLNLFQYRAAFQYGSPAAARFTTEDITLRRGVGRQLYPQLDLWKTAKPFLESWIKDQVGIPALVRAFKDKAPFWIERMPEIPELVYQSLQQSKQLQTSVDTIVRDMHVCVMCARANPVTCLV